MRKLPAPGDKSWVTSSSERRVIGNKDFGDFALIFWSDTSVTWVPMGKDDS